MPKMIERGFFSAEIKLSDPQAGMPSGVDPIVQILRVGAFNHPKYGELEITPLILAEMKSNFDAGIRGIDIALDYFHNSDREASGWLKSLELREEGQELWGEVDWTPKARKMLSERELRYFSPDFAFEWTDPETEKTYQNVLFGGGLTNRPFVKDMAAIVASEKKGETMTLAEMEKKVLKLAEDGEALQKAHADLQAKHADLLNQHSALKAKLDEQDGDDDEEDSDDEDGEPKTLDEAKKQLDDAKAKLAEMSDKVKKSEEAKQMAEKEKAFNLLMTEGKACAAQKESYLKGDMEKFISLAEKVNLGGKGHGGGSSEEKTGDREDRVLKLAEEKVKKDGIALHEAIKLANAEVKE